MKRYAVVAVALLVVGAGCSFGESKQRSEAAVETFHAQMNGSRFIEIYAGATPTFRSTSPAPEFEKFMGAVQRKLGGFKTAQLGTWRVNATSAGTFVSLQYDSQFDRGSAVEDFTFLVVDSRPTLHGYNINSRALVVE